MLYEAVKDETARPLLQEEAVQDKATRPPMMDDVVQDEVATREAANTKRLSPAEPLVLIPYLRLRVVALRPCLGLPSGCTTAHVVLIPKFGPG